MRRKSKDAHPSLSLSLSLFLYVYNKFPYSGGMLFYKVPLMVASRINAGEEWKSTV